MVTQRATAASSSAFDWWKYDVFLCFRGEDVRKNFISHLHYALTQKGIKTFVDDHLRRGEEIWSELIEAIEGSRIAIIVFSQNFASSTWCLDELLKIIECRESKGQMVLPVFFHVSPSEMRRENGCYDRMLRRHKEDRVSEEKLRKWSSALHQAANLSGRHLDNGVESELVQNIVGEVSSKLHRTCFAVASNPVGLDPHTQAMIKLLSMQVNDVRIVGVCGVSGVGKTTIAKALYNRIADQFEGSSFLENVSETSKQDGIMKLQDALLIDVLRNENVKVGHDHTGRHLLEDDLQNKRVLLVLDDVDCTDQLEDLTGMGQWLGLGSRIIVTTKDREILRTCHAETYDVRALSQDDALKLFCQTAFKQDIPGEIFKPRSLSLVNFTEGLPLAVIVLGSLLHGKTIQGWDRALSQLKEPPLTLVDRILRISFEDLEPHEKSIFLDIACFFNGADKDYATKMFHRCQFYPESALKILVEKSLITVGSNKIWMHGLLQCMGREIVHQESPDNPSARSRIWDSKDVVQVLHEKSGTDAIEGIRLDLLEPKKNHMTTKALRKMKRLRLIMVRNSHICGCPGYLENELKWLDLGANDLSHNRSQNNSSLDEAAPLEPIQSSSSISPNQLQFLSTGIDMTFSSSSSCRKNTKKTWEPLIKKGTEPIMKTPQQQQRPRSSASLVVMDEPLECHDFESSNKILQEEQFQFGELDLIADVAQFGDQILQEAPAAREVPQLPLRKSQNRDPYKASASSMPIKKRRMMFTENDDEQFTVPNLG